MSEIEAFWHSFLPRFIGSLRNFHNGDPEPHIALWSSTEPVTLFAIRGMRNIGTEAGLPHSVVSRPGSPVWTNMNGT